VEGTTGLERVEAIGRAYVRFAAEQPDYAAALSTFQASAGGAATAERRPLLGAADAINQLLAAEVQRGVDDGSIRRDAQLVHFQILEKERNLTLSVVYTGKDPLPDTFRDSAQAMADGKLQSDGTFHASSIAAKCPSKYEAAPGGKPAQQPLNSSKL
jgi:hypothetical protein